MSVVGLTVREAVESPAFRKLSPAERRILWAVSRVGGGELPITSGRRYGEKEFTHAQKMAFDFGGGRDRRKLPLLLAVAGRLMSRDWRGGVGLGKPPADLHLHVDARGYPAYFIEYSRARPVITGPLNLKTLAGLRRDYRAPGAAGRDVVVFAAVAVAVLAGAFIVKRAKAQAGP